jgi:hypothetical protein
MLPSEAFFIAGITRFSILKIDHYLRGAKACIMNYRKYSDEDILETYNSMLEYSGRADKDLIAEIESRGGLEKIKLNENDRNIIPDEVKRINSLVLHSYKVEPDTARIRNSISSSVLSPDELTRVIDAALLNAQSYYNDKKIDAGTIIRCLIGVAISAVAGAWFWCFSIMITGEMMFILITVIYVISFLIIRLFTRKSRNNVLVFLAGFVATLISIPLGLWFYFLNHPIPW